MKSEGLFVCVLGMFVCLMGERGGERYRFLVSVFRSRMLSKAAGRVVLRSYSGLCCRDGALKPGDSRS